MKKLVKLSLILFLMGFVVAACSDDDKKDPGPDSDPTPGGVPTSLATPTGLGATPMEDMASVYWDTVASANSYELALNDGNTVNSPNPYYAFVNLPSDTDFDWKVRAIYTNNTGTRVEGGWEYSSFKTLLPPNYGVDWVGNWIGEGVQIEMMAKPGGLLSIIAPPTPIPFNSFIPQLDSIQVEAMIGQISNDSIEIELKGLDTLFTVEKFRARIGSKGISHTEPLAIDRVMDFGEEGMSLPEDFDLGSMLGGLGGFGDILGGAGGDLSGMEGINDTLRTLRVYKIEMHTESVTLTGNINASKTELPVNITGNGTLSFRTNKPNFDMLLVNMTFTLTGTTRLQKE